MIRTLHRRVRQRHGVSGPWLLGVLALAATLLAGSAVLAEDTPTAAPDIFTITSRPAQEVADILWVVLPDLKPNVRVGPQDILVVSGLSPELRTVVEQLISRFDVPQATFEVRARLILAASDYKQMQPVPKELQDLAGHLSSVFAFKKYEMLDDVFLTVKDGSPATTVLAGGMYQLQFTVRGEPPNDGGAGAAGSVAFRKFVLGKRDVVRVEEETRGDTTVRKEIMGYKPVLETSFWASTGTPMVVGSSRMGDDSKALIVVLTVEFSGK